MCAPPLNLTNPLLPQTTITLPPLHSAASTSASLLASASEAVLPPADCTDTSATTTSPEAAAAAVTEAAMSAGVSGDTSTPAPGPPAAAVPAAPAPDQSKRDNWDSVSEQPYCDVCKSAFKSAGACVSAPPCPLSLSLPLPLSHSHTHTHHTHPHHLHRYYTCIYVHRRPPRQTHKILRAALQECESCRNGHFRCHEHTRYWAQCKPRG